MRSIFTYISDYLQTLDKRVLVAVLLFTGILVWLNYRLGLEKKLCFAPKTWTGDFAGHYLIFLVAFAVPYLFCTWLKGSAYFNNREFTVLLLLAPAIFALKVSLSPYFNFSADPRWNSYWNKVIYWPFLLLLIAGILWLTAKIAHHGGGLYGISSRNFDWRPYGLMLCIMIPLVVFASTQADFLSLYPRMKTITDITNSSARPWFYKLLYQLSYGSDFFTIELFFRGFLILGFIGIAGKDAILPMACFYCTIHFGKPLAECISSFFGGVLLGIIVYNTRSILGGLMVHVGIAWMMEAGGYWGNYWKAK